MINFIQTYGWLIVFPLLGAIAILVIFAGIQSDIETKQMKNKE